jgi:hypothetical protein
MAKRGFLREEHRRMLVIKSDGESLVAELESHTPDGFVAKWDVAPRFGTAHDRDSQDSFKSS